MSFCVKGCTHTQKVGAGWPLEMLPPHKCYPVEFRHSRSNDAIVMKEIPLEKAVQLVWLANKYDLIDWNQNLHQRTTYHQYRMTCGWYIAIKPSSNGGRLPSWFFEIWYFGQMTCQSAILLLRSKFRFHRTINRWDLARRRFFRDIGLVMMSKYCIRDEPYFTFLIKHCVKFSSRLV